MKKKNLKCTFFCAGEAFAVELLLLAGVEEALDVELLLPAGDEPDVELRLLAASCASLSALSCASKRSSVAFILSSLPCAVALCILQPIITATAKIFVILFMIYLLYF